MPRHDHLPVGTGTLGLLLFLASLAMLFVASIVGYAVIRTTGRLSPATGVIHLPGILWISTVVMFAAAAAMQQALSSVQRERQGAFRTSLGVAFALSLGFLAIQTPGLITLVRRHVESMSANIHVFGLIFCLVLLHAAHVLGGVIPLAVACVRARWGRYDHEHYLGIKHLAIYWHFLDGVWLLMFVTFLVLS